MASRTIHTWIKSPAVKALSYEARDLLFNLVMACDESGFLPIDSKLISNIYDTTRIFQSADKEKQFLDRVFGELCEHREDGSIIVMFKRKQFPKDKVWQNFIWVQHWEDFVKPRYATAHERPSPDNGDVITGGNLPVDALGDDIPSSPIEAILQQARNAQALEEKAEVIQPLEIDPQPTVQNAVFEPADVPLLLEPPDPFGGSLSPVEPEDAPEEPAVPSFDASAMAESMASDPEWPSLVSRVEAKLAEVGKSTTPELMSQVISESRRNARAAVAYLEMLDLSDAEYSASSGVAVLKRVWCE